MKGDGRKLLLFRTVDHADVLRGPDAAKSFAECGAAHEGDVAVRIPGVPDVGAAKALGEDVGERPTAGSGAGVALAVVEVGELRENQTVDLAEGRCV